MDVDGHGNRSLVCIRAVSGTIRLIRHTMHTIRRWWIRPVKCLIHYREATLVLNNVRKEAAVVALEVVDPRHISLPALGDLDSEGGVEETSPNSII